MKYHRWLLISLLFLTLAVPCFAKSWRNIFPLKTTRAEVLWLLGTTQGNWTPRGESFEFENNTITIRWIRADCIDQNVINKDQLVNFTSSNLLVAQITIIPKVPLTHEIIEEEEANIPAPKVLLVSKSDGKPVEESLIFYYTSCLGQGRDAPCSYSNKENGFGYSTSGKDVTAIYYYSSEKELADWEENRRPCSSK